MNSKFDRFENLRLRGGTQKFPEKLFLKPALMLLYKTPSISFKVLSVSGNTLVQFLQNTFCTHLPGRFFPDLCVHLRRFPLNLLHVGGTFAEFPLYSLKWKKVTWSHIGWKGTGVGSHFCRIPSAWFCVFFGQVLQTFHSTRFLLQLCALKFIMFSEAFCPSSVARLDMPVLSGRRIISRSLRPFSSYSA